VRTVKERRSGEDEDFGGTRQMKGAEDKMSFVTRFSSRGSL